MSGSNKSSKERNADRKKMQNLLNKIPEKQDFLWNMLTFSNSSELAWHTNERSVAIIGAAYAEFGVKEAIKRKLPTDSSDPDFSYLFDQEGAVCRDFSAKNRIARAIDAIPRNMYDDLEIIRHIRNMFAHSMETVSFSFPAVEKLCGDLSVVFPPFKEPADNDYVEKLRNLVFETAMYKYMKACDFYHIYLGQKSHPLTG